jgi:hypothetical protein
MANHSITSNAKLRERRDWQWDGFDPSTIAKVLMEDYPAMPMGDCLEHHMKW